jgi:hypothetical protein
MSTWPTTRKRPPGRHTSLIDGGDDPGGALSTIDDWLRPGLTGLPDAAGHTGNDGHDGMAEPSSLGGVGTRVWIRGEDPAAGGPGTDTMVLSDPGLFRRTRPGIGLDRPVPPSPWYRRRWWLLAVVAGLAVVAWVSILEMPPLLAAVGIDAPPACQLCQFPLPSSPPVGPATGSSPAMSSPAPPPARTTAPSASASPPVPAVAPQPAATTPDTPPTVSATYTATPAGGSSFTGQITVINRGTAPITGWKLVVALPGDTVSAVQNAEFTDDNDVLFMTPAPYDLSIGPGSTATITIYASGPDPTPAECSFDTVACQ